MKNKKGITLVALIITIIVMLILVNVSVQIVIKSDLIGTAENTVEKYKIAHEQEQNIGKITVDGKTYDNIEDYINGKESMPTIIAGQRATTNSKYTDGTDTAIIPKGFTVSGVKTATVDETTIKEGLVIYLIPEGATVDWTDGVEVAKAQKNYDQFVWIPIKNATTEKAQDINDMYICQGKTENNGLCTIKVENGVAKCTNKNHSIIAEETGKNKNTLMAGRLYATSAAMSFEKAYTETYTSGSGLREPDTLSSEGYDGNSDCLEILSKILEPDAEEKKYTSEAKFKEKLQEEYNEVVKSVYENEGFYVGRYETSGMTQSVTDYNVSVTAGTLPSIEKDWYHMYAQQKNYSKANNLTVGSTMIQGAAYDQVMKFLDPTSSWITTTGKVSHDLGGAYLTAGLNYSGDIPYNDVSKNIYDLEGNVFAWTTEAHRTGSRMVRGGRYSLKTSASSRNNGSPNYSGSSSVGSICQLYIK